MVPRSCPILRRRSTAFVSASTEHPFDVPVPVTARAKCSLRATQNGDWRSGDLSRWPDVAHVREVMLRQYKRRIDDARPAQESKPEGHTT